MKKLVYLLMAALMGLALTACQEDNEKTATMEGEPSTAVAASQQQAQNTPPTAATPDQTARPDFQQTAMDMPKTTVEFETETYQFGKVPEGSKVTYRFKFKNTGNEPLTLTKVKASCGCTTPSYSKDPVAPGEDGFIDVEFNTANRTGVQTKSITVTGNFSDGISKMLKRLAI